MNNIYKFILNYKYHMAFWVCYMLFWMILHDELDDHGLKTNLIFLVMNALPVYINSRILMHKYFYKNQILIYVLLLIFIIVFFSFLLGVCLYGYFVFFELDPGSFFDFPLVLGPTLGSVASTTFIILVFELGYKYLKSYQANHVLEKQKLENELKHLKSQLNPHFLFNALNNIYFLIQKDQNRAAEALAGFSDMLRHQLYISDFEKIPLAQEIDYLLNYIKVSSLSSPDVNVELDIDEEISNEVISPMFLIPFIENAFKFVNSKVGTQKMISVHLSLKHRKMEYIVVNSFDKLNESIKFKGGIGLSNIKKRLALLYPNNSALEYGKYGNRYKARLELLL